MRDSRLNLAERRVQQLFSKSRLLSSLPLLALVLAAQGCFHARRAPLDLSPRTASIRFEPVSLGRMGPVGHVAGAWSVRVDDHRFGGLSGLIMDQGKLLALSDSGLVFAFAPPAESAAVRILALPAVPGNPVTKAGRDSEAIAADPDGRGWWVAFEGRHSLMLYDRGFRRSLRTISMLNHGFSRNLGIEALLPANGRLIAIPESAGVSDATLLADGRPVYLRRRFGLTGFINTVELDGRRWRLPLAPWDNAEGIAAAPLSDGRTRLWIVTDNDALPLRRTLLVAVDVPSTP